MPNSTAAFAAASVRVVEQRLRFVQVAADSVFDMASLNRLFIALRDSGLYAKTSAPADPGDEGIERISPVRSGRAA